jgi:hypothetical protein
LCDGIGVGQEGLMKMERYAGVDGRNSIQKKKKCWSGTFFSSGYEKCLEIDSTGISRGKLV